MSASGKENMYEKWLDDHSKWLCENTSKIDLVRIFASDGILDAQSDNQIRLCTGSKDEKMSILYNEVKKAGFNKIEVMIRALEETQQTEIANEFKHIKANINKRVCEDVVDEDEADKQSEILDFVTNEIPLTVSVKSKSGSKNFATSKTTANEYRNVSNPLGFALIINNLKFCDAVQNRNGAKNDSEYAKSLLQQLRYKVTLEENVLSSEIEKVLERFKKQFDNDVDSCIVVLMSHGKNTLFELSDGAFINIWQDIIYKFDNQNCPKLKGKPKIFIIQACQEFDPPRTSTDAVLPVSDILVCFSTIPGYVANRDLYLGSWYIYCLTKVFMENAHEMEITEMLQKIAKMKVKSEKDVQQVSSYQNILFRKFYFNPGL